MAEIEGGATQQVQTPLSVLVVGGGVAGLEAVFALREMAGERVRLTLLAPTGEFVYRPMAVGEPFTSGWARHYPLARLAAEAGAELVSGAVAEVEASERRVRTTGGQALSYDALMVCTGASAQPRYEHATTVDDARMDEVLHGVVQDVEEGYVKRLAIVIPAPMPWPLPAYELALMCSERAWDMQTDMTVTVVTPEDSPLEVFGDEASRSLKSLLGERNIEVVGSAYAEVPKAKTVTIHPAGTTLEFDRVVALPELRGPYLAGLPADPNGFIAIDEVARVRGVERVWAAGDATDFPIKFGGVAAQLADTAAQSIAALAGVGSEPNRFEPVLEGVLLTGGTPRFVHGGSTGEHGELSQLAAEVRPPKIAARYLTPYLNRASSSSSSGAP
jgi:sulfide:quinone oxidoreductase